jgi:hypothetical protein
MAAALTDEDFESLLEADLAWRRIELHALKTQLSSQATINTTSPATRALARSLLTLLYAHWEGYSKCAFDHYATLIMRRKPVAIDVNDALFGAHATHLLRRVVSGDLGARDELLNMARATDSPRIRLPKSQLSDTKSNLRYHVLKSILDGFGISIASFETKERLIDVLLCDRRNAVAHGRDSFPEPKEVISLHSEVLAMMERVLEEVTSAVRSKQYMRAASAI